MKDAVMFLFTKNNGSKVLLEHRLTDKNKFEEIFIPNGSVEPIDRDTTENYLVSAMKREIKEEFCGKVVPINFISSGSYTVHEIGIIFYIFIVNSWSGKHPIYAEENGKRSARLKWHSIEEALKIMPYPSGIYALNLLTKPRKKLH